MKKHHQTVMTSRERVLAALKRQPVDRIPYCEHIVDPTVAFKTTGTAGFIKAFARIAKRLGLAGLFRDMPTAMKLGKTGGHLVYHSPEVLRSSFRFLGALEPEISRVLNRDNVSFWGAFCCFSNYQLYLLDPAQSALGYAADGIIKDWDDLDKLAFRDIGEVVEMAKEFLAWKGDKAANAMIFLGIDPTWHSMGFENFCMKLVEDPDLVTAVLSRISGWYAAVAEELCKLDFDFVWAFDDIAYHTAPFFSPRLYREVLLPETRKVAAQITKPWVYHSDGNLMPILDDLLGQGMNAIHPLEHGSMDIQKLKDDYGRRLSFVGNIDLVKLANGTEQDITDEVRAKITILGRDYGYLMSSSNSITPECKPENVARMLDALCEYGTYPLVLECMSGE